MKQSSVEWLNRQIRLDSKSKVNSKGGISFTMGLSKIDELFTKAKEMENQKQVDNDEDLKRAFKTGFSIGYGSAVNGLDSKDETCEIWFKNK